MNTFPFSAQELTSRAPTAIPASFVVRHGIGYWLEARPEGRCLAVMAPASEASSLPFHGEGADGPEGYALRLCPVDHANAAALRRTLPWLQPMPLGLTTSAGVGDRLGIATPGHVRAFQQVLKEHPDKTLLPIFAQQSIREMERTGRSPEEVLDDATWGTFEGGWTDRVGADADHLKKTADIDVCAAQGFSFYTVDPGAYVDGSVEQADAATVQSKAAALDWAALETSLADFEGAYVGQSVNLEEHTLALDRGAVLKAAAKYGAAIAHVVHMYRYLASQGIPFEFEVSVDETDTPTTHVEHLLIVSEMRRLGVQWVSLAPRYIGRFEKGVDYIGDLAAFEADFAVHAAIARAYGPYKLSLHSGSDKFSVYGIAARQTRGLVHLKTAGTSYLVALQTLAQLDPAFFRELYTFARARYETDKASYHVSAQLERAPKPEDVADRDLPALLDQFDAREIAHVTFGSVLTTRGADGQLVYYPRFMKVLRDHPEEYAENIKVHFLRHLRPFVAY